MRQIMMTSSLMVVTTLGVLTAALLLLASSVFWGPIVAWKVCRRMAQD